MSLIIIQNAQLSHYEYNGVEYNEPKIYTSSEGKKVIVFEISEAIAVWNKQEQKNDFKRRHWKCVMFGYVAEQFEKEYDFNPNTITKISFTGKLNDTVEGTIPVGQYEGKAYRDTLAVQPNFTINSVIKKNKEGDAQESTHDVDNTIEDDIPF